jgi:hypothetical protein
MAAAEKSSGATRWWAAWSVVAAFGTYFCMYAFRKPFAAAIYEDAAVAGIDFKTLLVVSQVGGYMVSKFIGIKVVAEMPPRLRARSILVLIGIAELALLLFGIVPAPWSAACLFFNGLPLGMVFGLVLGFLEGRRQTEILTAGLCASFILADGVTKSLGAALLTMGVPTHWMPFAAGLVAAPLLLLFVGMLARIPAPNDDDIAARAPRATMDRSDRLFLLGRYASGLFVLVGMYLLITIVRSMRSDFAAEIWQGLGEPAAPGLFTYSEIHVALGVVIAGGATVLIVDNRLAFFASLAICGAGFAMIVAALVGRGIGALSPFAFMVLVGLGLYLPYVAVHTTVFERLLAMTRNRGTIGFLMYVADAFGYLGYVAVMLCKHLLTAPENLLGYFLAACWCAAGLSLLGLVYVWNYFARKCPAAALVPATEGAA